MKPFCLALILCFQTAQAYTDWAAKAAKNDVTKNKAIETKDTLKVVDKVLQDNLKPQTAAVVSMVAEKALKESDEKPGREPEDKVATEQGTSLSDRADAEIQENVPEEVIACGAKRACDGKPKCPCDEKPADDKSAEEKPEDKESSSKDTEKKEEK